MNNLMSLESQRCFGVQGSAYVADRETPLKRLHTAGVAGSNPAPPTKMVFEIKVFAETPGPFFLLWGKWGGR
jgi:hypothetical protein